MSIEKIRKALSVASVIVILIVMMLGYFHGGVTTVVLSIIAFVIAFAIAKKYLKKVENDRRTMLMNGVFVTSMPLIIVLAVLGNEALVCIYCEVAMGIIWASS